MFGRHIYVPLHSKCELSSNKIDKKVSAGQTRDKGDPQNMNRFKMFDARYNYSCMHEGLFITGKNISVSPRMRLILTSRVYNFGSLYLHACTIMLYEPHAGKIY